MTSQCGNFDTEWPGTWVVCVHRKDVLFFEQVIKPIIETCKKKIDQITKKLSSSDFFYGWPFGTWFLLIHSHHVRDGEDWKKILEKHVFIIKSGKTYKSMHIEKLHILYVLQHSFKYFCPVLHNKHCFIFVSE